MKRRTVSSLLLTGVLLLTAIPGVTYSEVYTYKDSKGTVSYVDDLGKVPSRYRSRAKAIEDSQSVTIIESASAPAGKVKSGPTPPALNQAKGKVPFAGTIEMYVTSTCPYCKVAEVYLKNRHYSYVKYDIEKDKAAQKREEGYPGNGVPLFILGDKSFRGFSPPLLEDRMNH